MYHDFPSGHFQRLGDKDNVVLLETSKYDGTNYRSYLFTNPIETLQIYSADDFAKLLRDIERCLQNKYYLAGYFGYECGYHFENIAPVTTFKEPIAFFGVYPQPLIFNHMSGEFENTTGPGFRFNGSEMITSEQYSLRDIRIDINEEDYSKIIDRIEDYIRSGDTYQINFTTKYRFNFQGNLLKFYEELKKKQRVSYGAFISAHGRTILSFSPELFFRLTDGIIITRPMKGTVKRGKTLEEDRLLQEWLSRDEKSRAENVMIVDLLRNDLGKICGIGSVTVSKLFAVEKYQTLHQMTSTVEGRVRRGISYYEILKSIFPCGSVTGAPKIRSMQIIDELETSRRGVYTGAIGYFSPAGEAVFNVAIRTLVLRGESGEMGVGSGILADSTAKGEYAECQLKAEFLTKPHEEFDLLETILWHNGYPFLAKHLKRMSESAEYFDFPLEIGRIGDELLNVSKSFERGKKYKVRLRLDRSGKTSIECSLIDDSVPLDTNVITFSEVRVHSDNFFLYHKTTNRRLYDEALLKAQRDGFREVLFRNENNQITEGAISNVIVKKGNYFLTPPVQCGLLNGIYRQHLLETQSDLKEEVLYEKDLREAGAIYICNSIQGMRRVQLSADLCSIL